MPSYKLYYFDARGRAEIMRLMFNLRKTEFEDVRVKDWPSIKSKMPQGQLPVLEVDGKLIPQSGAIIRYLAEQLGLFGKDPLDRLQCDVIMETINDILKVFRPIKMEKDKQKKEDLKKNFEDNLPKFLETFQKLLNENKYFVGNEISVADVAFFDCIYEIRKVFGDVLKNQTQLAEVYKKVETELSDYLKNRPNTEF